MWVSGRAARGVAVGTRGNENEIRMKSDGNSSAEIQICALAVGGSKSKRKRPNIHNPGCSGEKEPADSR
ncbi:hypothetical protein CesoFtcFv8_021385 [Champsocephalus esox]|uniref:Uncharacterized protein n=1 Tax=Champsocephalus esox TaxID=159716 RepID=A0AAN8BDH8_9TELE|nr:hypothetical protein CesoFtcFv8_021385 [Champsocephalus esox]